MAIRRGQQQNWSIQLVTCNVSHSNIIVDYSPSISRMAHQEYSHTRAGVGNRCHLRLSCAELYISLYEGDTTNSLCMCAFSAIKGCWPISRPCLIHYLSVPQCFFATVNYLYCSRSTSPFTARQAGRQAGGSCRCHLLNSDHCSSPLDTVIQEQSSLRAQAQSTGVTGLCPTSLHVLDFYIGFYQTNTNPDLWSLDTASVSCFA